MSRRLGRDDGIEHLADGSTCTTDSDHPAKTVGVRPRTARQRPRGGDRIANRLLAPLPLKYTDYCPDSGQYSSYGRAAWATNTTGLGARTERSSAQSGPQVQSVANAPKLPMVERI